MPTTVQTIRAVFAAGFVAATLMLAGGTFPVEAHSEEVGMPDGLYVVQQDGKFGLVDKAGKVICEPKLADLSGFSEGLLAAQVERGGKRGYVNVKGEVVIPPKFDNAFPFHQGLALVRIGDVDWNWQVKPTQRFVFGKHGYIRKSGEFAIEPRFDIAKTFSEGLAAVNIGGTNGVVEGGGKWGYIDTTGKFAIPLQFDDAWSFHNGRAVVGVGARISQQCGGKWGMIDKAGKYVVEPDYDWIFNRPEGGHFKTRNDGKFGYIGVGGNIIPPQFDAANTFQEGLAAVRMGDKWGFIDEQGRLVVDPQFAQCRDFSDGRAAVVAAGKWGFIDRVGTMSVPAVFEKVCGFLEGFCAVEKDGKVGIIRKDGSWLLEPTLDRWEDFPPCFKEGLLAFRRGGKYGYINSKGAVAIEPRFGFALPFLNGLAYVRLPEGGDALIDTAGNVIWRASKSEPMPAKH